ncbi:MAG: DUF805 domain-containing protein [Hyphomonadaceae bacterium]|nr:DUF805 domain-containing protein [Hyphomonadaceae bacterium]
MVVVAWPWIALWVKRYHDAGKSGWWCLIPMAVFIIASSIFDWYVGDYMTFLAVIMALLGQDLMAINISLIQSLVTIATLYLIAFLFNRAIRHDPNDNRFGPADGPAHSREDRAHPGRTRMR